MNYCLHHWIFVYSIIDFFTSLNFCLQSYWIFVYNIIEFLFSTLFLNFRLKFYWIFVCNIIKLTFIIFLNFRLWSSWLLVQNPIQFLFLTVIEFLFSTILIFCLLLFSFFVGKLVISKGATLWVFDTLMFIFVYVYFRSLLRLSDRSNCKISVNLLGFS